MSEAKAQHDIENLVARLARRIRLQRASEGLTTGLIVTLLIALVTLVLFKTGWLEATTFWEMTVGSLVVPLGLAFAGWLRPLDPIALAQHIDRKHGLHDRLSTALALASAGSGNDFERAQIADAARFIKDVDIKPVAPFSRPTDWWPALVLVALFAGLTFLRPPSNQHPLPKPPAIRHDEILDPATLAMERDQLEQIKKQLEGSEDPEAKQLVDDIGKLLDKVQKRSISQKDFLDEIQRLQKKHFGEDPAETERLADKLKEAAEQLEKESKKDLEKEPDAKALVNALKKRDLNAASKALDKLADKLASKDLSDKQLERIARLLQKFGDKIDPNDPALQKLIEKHKDLIDKLSKKFKNGKGLTDKEKQRLNRAKKEMQKLQQQQQKQQKRDSTRQLKKLHRLSQEASEQAQKVLHGNQGHRKATSEQKHHFKQQAGRKVKQEANRLKKQGNKQRTDAAKRMAEKQLRDLREAMQRSSAARSGGSNGQGKNGKSSAEQQKGTQMKEYLRRAKGMVSAGDKPAPKMGKKGGSLQRFSGANGTTHQGKDFGGEIKGKTNMAGHGKGSRQLGKATHMDAKYVDEHVDGVQGKGPSSSEIIRAASEDGFANTKYKKVYEDYKSVTEEVMQKEKVPSGYRYYVKRYFQLIQPQEQ